MRRSFSRGFTAFFSSIVRMVIAEKIVTVIAKITKVRVWLVSQTAAAAPKARIVPRMLNACIYPLVSPRSAGSVRSGRRAQYVEFHMFRKVYKSVIQTARRIYVFNAVISIARWLPIIDIMSSMTTVSGTNITIYTIRLPNLVHVLSLIVPITGGITIPRNRVIPITIPIKKLDNVLKADFARGSKSNGITFEFNERTNPAPIEAEASDNFCFLDNIIFKPLLNKKHLKPSGFF